MKIWIWIWISTLYVHYATLLYLPPLRFNCVWGCRDRTQDCCDFGINRQSLSAGSHPHSASYSTKKKSTKSPFKEFLLVDICVERRWVSTTIIRRLCSSPNTRMRDVNTRKVWDRLIYFNYIITLISHCAGWQIFPGSLPGFSARHN